jgi:hypothetical protein
MNPETTKQYQAVISECKALFMKKTRDYGTAWRIMRLPSITDQIYIKAQRIRSIQQKGTQRVSDDIAGEFIGIINYCIIALIQQELTDSDPVEIPAAQIEPKYDREVAATMALLENKNHDYDEAWRHMRVSSITDIILMKLLRIKQIEDNAGKTLVSEGVEGSYRDIINYSVFALILMKG